VPGGLRCETPCKSYVLTLAELATPILGLPVVATNLATNDGNISGRLLGRLKDVQRYRDAVASADIVTLQIGWNDWQGTCNFNNRVDCLASGMKVVEPNLDAILKQIELLREGKATAVRVVTYYDGFLGNPATGGIWAMPNTPANVATFDADFRKGLTAFNTMICRVAEANRGVCIDLAPVFNGPKGDQKAVGSLVNEDGIHPTAGGHALIAETILKAGFAELK
jgi:lysophospholipase L1-like esterase